MIWMLWLATLALAGNLWADPRQWTEDGVGLSIYQSLFEANTATNASGYTLLVWAGSDGGPSVVLGQLIAPTGENLWESEGRMLARGTWRAGYPAVLSVDDGWVIGWMDAEFVEWCDEPPAGGPCLSSAIRVIKIDNGGAPVWPGGVSGIEVAPLQVWSDYYPFTLYPSGGGAIVTWGGNWDQPVMQALGISASGTPWPQPTIMGPELWGYGSRTVSDMQGGLFITWISGVSVDTVVHANRLLSTGELAWADVNGLAVINAHDTLTTNHAICADGSGGMYVVYKTGRDGSSVHMQRLNENGATVWAEPAQPTTESSSVDFSSLMLSRNGAGFDGVILDLYSVDLRYQKISANGERLWGNTGVLSCAGLHDDAIVRTKLISDRQGGLLLNGLGTLYDEHGNFVSYEVRLARILAGGSLGWNGNCAVAGPAFYYYPQVYSPTFVGENLRQIWLDPYPEARVSYRDIVLDSGAPVDPQPFSILAKENRTTTDMRTVRLGGGRMAVAWLVRTVDRLHARFQIMDAFGQRVFPQEGIPLNYNPDGTLMDARFVDLCEDGAGGFFAFTVDENQLTTNIHFMHIGPNGEFLTPAEGISVLTSPVGGGVPYPPVCVPDGQGGAYVAASVLDVAYYASVAVMRVDASGAAMWDSAMVFHGGDSDAFLGGLVRSAGNSCLVTYTVRTAFPNGFVKCARLSENGTIVWETPLWSEARDFSTELRLCGDGAGGAYVCYVLPGSTENQLRIQRVSHGGQLLWENGGVLLNSDSASWAIGMGCDADALGNVSVVWQQGDWGNADIKAQRLNADGEIMWGDGGMQISEDTHDQGSPRVAVVSDNEVYFAWEDFHANVLWWYNPSVRVTHYNAAGQRRDDSWWQENGNDIVASAGSQRSPLLATDGAGGALLAWLDSRAGVSSWDASLFVQKLWDPIFTEAEVEPVVPVEFALAQNYPNPFNPETVIEFSLPRAAETSLKVFDVLGREVATLVNAPMEVGVHRVIFDASALASGVYFYRVEAGEFRAVRKMVLMR